MRMTMAQATSSASTGYRGGRGSPIGIGGAIAVHAVVAGAFLLIPKEVIAPYVPQILIGTQIPLTPPPPPENVPEQTESPIQKPVTPDPRPAIVDPLMALPGSGEQMTGGADLGGSGVIEPILPPADPPKPPVLVEPAIDSRALSAFQPDYPRSMLRQSVEGKVTVRVTIGVDGRVADVERIAATDEAFWIATQRHALRKWRFRPATRDGVPVSGTKVLTVHFRLTDI